MTRSANPPTQPLSAVQRRLVVENVRLVPYVTRLLGMTGERRLEAESDGYVGLCCAAQTYDPGRSRFVTWAVLCIRQAIWKSRRDRRRAEAHHVVALREDDNVPDDATEPDWDGLHADDLLRALSEREQFVLWQRAEGNTLETIGKTLHVSKERVRQIARRAENRVRLRVTQDAKNRENRRLGPFLAEMGQSDAAPPRPAPFGSAPKARAGRAIARRTDAGSPSCA